MRLYQRHGDPHRTGPLGRHPADTGGPEDQPGTDRHTAHRRGLLLRPHCQGHQGGIVSWERVDGIKTSSLIYYLPVVFTVQYSTIQSWLVFEDS